MADQASRLSRDDAVSTEKKLDDLYELIDGIEMAMMTTRRPDGRLVSRPMQTQKRTAGCDLWFVTNWYADKLDEIAVDPNVNLAYLNRKSWDWVSVSGHAIISRDRDLVRGLYKPDWKAWFPDDGQPGHDGSPDDERIALVLVETQSVVYSKKNKPKPLVLFEIAKAMITGSTPNVSDLRTVSERELRADATRATR